METPPVFVRHECNVFTRPDILEGFHDTSLNGFYFNFVVGERTDVYSLCSTTYEWVCRYNLNSMHNSCFNAVVRVEDITRDYGRAFRVITGMLRYLNISEMVDRNVAEIIYFKAYWLTRQLDNVTDIKIPLRVDIVKVFQKAIIIPSFHQVNLNMNMNLNLNPWSIASNPDENNEDEEDVVAHAASFPLNEHGCNDPVPTARSAIEALEVVSLRPKGECAICIGGLIKATRMPCGHKFHSRCIVRWLRGKNVCPLCRFRMPAADDY